MVITGTSDIEIFRKPIIAVMLIRIRVVLIVVTTWWSFDKFLSISNTAEVGTPVGGVITVTGRIKIFRKPIIVIVGEPYWQGFGEFS